MYKRFSKPDCLVLIVLILLAILTLGAIGRGADKRLKAALCLSNLRQWGNIWQAYLSDNDLYFPAGYTGESDDSGRWWKVLKPYYGDNEALKLCPEATAPSSDFWGNWSGSPQGPFMAWGDFGVPGVAPKTAYISAGKGSYGLNYWIYNETPADGVRPDATDGAGYWRHAQVAAAARVPVFTECTWVVGYHGSTGGVTETDSPPESEMRRGCSAISCHCLNRHEGAVNVLFMDSSARRIGLKQLWTLKWSRGYDTAGPWTQAGGVEPDDWPEWMRKYKDY